MAQREEQVKYCFIPDDTKLVTVHIAENVWNYSIVR